ncbi:MAG: hypothetical protein M1819_002489 [Sarea resinae]|nr:MAG: hypothetical protein M1819_002489 [Sarea resinae]
MSSENFESERVLSSYRMRITYRFGPYFMVEWANSEPEAAVSFSRMGILNPKGPVFLRPSCAFRLDDNRNLDLIVSDNWGGCLSQPGGGLKLERTVLTIE